MLPYVASDNQWGLPCERSLAGVTAFTS
jgi:hypothetical protein